MASGLSALTLATIEPNFLSLMEYWYSLITLIPNLSVALLNPAANDFPKSFLSVMMTTRFLTKISPISFAPARP